MSLIKFIYILLVFNFSLIFQTGFALFEDQVGKFDWHQKNFGRIKFLSCDPNQPKRIIVGTENNIVGAINANTGTILYRNILETNGKLLYYGNFNPPSIRSILAISKSEFGVKVRFFTTTTGIQTEEIFITKDTDAEFASEVNGKIYLFNFPKESEIAINVYGKERHDSFSEFKDKVCKNPVIVGQFLLCSDTNNKKTLSVLNFVDSVWSSQTFDGEIEDIYPSVDAFTVVTKQKRHYFIANGKELKRLESSVNGIITQGKDTTWALLGQDSIELYGETLKLTSSHKLTNPNNFEFTLGKVNCQNDKCSLVAFTKNEDLIGFDFDGIFQWQREESLGNILEVEMVDYPTDNSNANPYFYHKNFVKAFLSRIQFEISSLLKYDRFYSAIDRFGIRKVIVFVTKVGKIIGMDSDTGSILYAINLPKYQESKVKSLNLYVQRPAKYAPLKPQATVLYQIEKSVIAFPFNPLDGKELGKGHTEYSFQLKQSQMLLQSASDKTKFLKPILLLDSQNNIHTYPEKLDNFDMDNCYFLVGNDRKIEGFYVDKTSLKAKKLWEQELAFNIQAIFGKYPGERVHSQGRVLPDRSVSYKYMNPNLIAVVTSSNSKSEEASVVLYLIDAVSGSMVHSFWHKKSKGPVHLVHSEHWIVYSIFSIKNRRYEVNSIEMYEGQVQSNSTAFSSFSAPVVRPIIVKQAYIFPSSIQGMTQTRTEKGITNKDLLIGLPSGGVLELPRGLVQPRLSQQHYVQQVDDEFSHQHAFNYIPELPVPPEMIINYNQSVRRIDGIKSFPTKLESTCLILVYGNDLFLTRVTPSKTFDVLKDDFDHIFIAIVLFGLCAAAYITKRFAQKKQLEQAWR